MGLSIENATLGYDSGPNHTLIMRDPFQKVNVLKLPLLIWIDDNPSNNGVAVAYALTLGINVVQLTLTVLVKAWIKSINGKHLLTNMLLYSCLLFR